MDISLLYKIAGVGLLVMVFCQVLKGLGREDYSALVSITGIIIVLFLIIAEAGKLFEAIQTTFGIR